MLFRVAELDVCAGGPEQSSRKPRNDSREVNQPRVAASIIVPKTSHVQWIAHRGHHETSFGLENVQNKPDADRPKGEECILSLMSGFVHRRVMVMYKGASKERGDLA